MTLLVSGNHRELIQFFLIPSSSLPAILGFPWLACHNPQTDWTSGSVTGWSTACHAHCLRSTLPPASPSSNIPPATADLTAVPEVYHDISGMSSKQRACTPPSWAALPGLRELLPPITAPVLSHPDSACQFAVEVNASDFGVVVVLSQRREQD